MPKSPRNLRLDEALLLPGCPICRVVLQRVTQTLESMQDELVLDPAWREQVDSAWGFCTLHAQQWLSEAQPLSTAIIYDAVLTRLTRELERVTPRAEWLATIEAPGQSGWRPARSRESVSALPGAR